MSQCLIIKDNKTFRENLSGLGKGDVLVGLLNIKPTEEYLFLDLVERGIIMMPSALSQQISRSKCLQASVYKDFMVDHTFIARDRHDLIIQINIYGSRGIGQVVTKQNRFNCGLGVHVWQSIESVYNQACFGDLDFPFVVQPLIKDIIDVRVVILGNYLEAYWRKNPNSFRNNIFFGGESGEYQLSSYQIELCNKVMERGKFPYAHIDFMVTGDGKTYLSEINLRGGLKGAKISGSDYKKRIQDLEEKFIESPQHL